MTNFSDYDKIIKTNLEVIVLKSTGIIRKLDKMGRIVLPMETRKLMSLADDEAAVEIYTENDMVILKKYTPSCIFCNNTEGLIEFHGAKICESCIETLNEKSKEVL